MPHIESILTPTRPREAGVYSLPRQHGGLARRRVTGRIAQEPVDVSVCIASWNCRSLLRECLLSLRDEQRRVRLEVIVIDNASTDGAAEMVSREFPEVTLHVNPANFGFSRANNQAAERSRGRYLFFLNNDTSVPPGAIGELLDYAQAHPDIGMLGPRLRDPEGRTQLSYRRRPTVAPLLHRSNVLRWTRLFRSAYRHYRRQSFTADSTRPVEVLMGAALFVPRTVFCSVGGWDEKFTFGGEDMDLSYQVGKRFPVIYHPEVEILHHGRVSTRQHIGYVSPHMAIGFARFLRKTGCPWPALWVYKLTIILDAPVQLIDKALQCLWRKLHGRHADAEKSRLAMLGQWYFLRRALIPFLRA
jgi:N-acetylglucosaminyl-diphospho-decaprenol L-rhamnosyltransferase